MHCARALPCALAAMLPIHLVSLRLPLPCHIEAVQLATGFIIPFVPSLGSNLAASCTRNKGDGTLIPLNTMPPSHTADIPIRLYHTYKAPQGKEKSAIIAERYAGCQVIVHDQSEQVWVNLEKDEKKPSEPVFFNPTWPPPLGHPLVGKRDGARSFSNYPMADLIQAW